MSQYRIYQIDHFDPIIVGRKIRVRVMVYVILAPVLVFSFAFCVMILKINIGMLFAVFLPLLFIFYVYRFHKLGSTNRHLKVIGKLVFTRTGIKKSIGDLSMDYDFQSIKKIELKKHLPVAGISGSLSDNFTYILRIIFFNSSPEAIVVSYLPEDKKPNINIVQTLKTLKNFIKTEISIES